MEDTIAILQGKTLEQAYLGSDNETVEFLTTDGEHYRLYHSQDCCEHVYVEDVIGDLGDLVGSPLLVAEEVSSENEPDKPGAHGEQYQWTFYKLATIKGSVTLRWYGASDYYSTSVSFAHV